MDRTSTIQDLAMAMGLEVKRSDSEYESKYNSSTGTYYCHENKKRNQKDKKKPA